MRKSYAFLCGKHDIKVQLLKVIGSFRGDNHELLHRNLYRYILIQAKEFLFLWHHELLCVLLFFLGYFFFLLQLTYV